MLQLKGYLSEPAALYMRICAEVRVPILQIATKGTTTTLPARAVALANVNAARAKA